MRNKLFIILLFLLSGIQSQAQKVELIKIEQLKERFKKGSDTTYIINLWATWCAPCVKELPYFEKLQAKYLSQPVKIILVSTDFRSQLDSKVKPLVKKMQLRNEVYLVDKKNDQEFIESISKDWEGAIPGTLFVHEKKALWKFYPQEFSYDELEKTYQSLR